MEQIAVDVRQYFDTLVIGELLVLNLNEPY
jgi:hypothetical protein